WLDHGLSSEGGFGSDVYSERRCPVEPVEKGSRMPYCTQHHRLYVPTLGQWVPFPHVHLSGTVRELPLTETCCDRCLALATTSMAQQFPHLYMSSAALHPK